MDLKSVLRQICDDTARGRSREHILQENEKVEIEVFTKCFNERKIEPEDDGSSTTIPKFYFKMPKEEEKLAQKLREESRVMLLQRRNRQLLSNNELKALWRLLDKHRSSPYYSEEQFINYYDFVKVGELAGTVKDINIDLLNLNIIKAWFFVHDLFIIINA